MTSNKNTLKTLALTTALTTVLTFSLCASADDERSAFHQDPSHRENAKKEFIHRTVKNEADYAKSDMITIKDVELKTSKADDASVYNNTLLKAYIDKILAGPLSKSQLERYILLIMEIPGFEVEDELTSSNVLVLYIKRQKFSLGFHVNNHGNKDLGKYQGSVVAMLNNPLGINDRLAVDLGTSNRTNSLQLGTASYSKILNSYGTSINFIGSALKSNSFKKQGLVAPNGSNHLVKGYLAQQIILNNTGSFLVDIGAEGRKVKAYTVTATTPATVASDYKYVLGFVGAKIQLKDGIGGDNFLFPTFHKTINDAHVTAATVPDNNFDKGFQYFTLDYIRDQSLPIKNMSLFLNVLWQTTSDKLPSEKQFFTEIQSVGRGYTTGLINSDKGLNGVVELRYTHRFCKSANTFQVYGFYNTARFDDPRDIVDKKTLNSAGGGVRLYITPGIAVEAEVAHPLTKHSTVAGIVTKNSTNFIFALSKKFSW